jgi:hypothetical protein
VVVGVVIRVVVHFDERVRLWSESHLNK